MTIHLRLASQTGSQSQAHACLTVCLRVLRQNQEANRAVKRADSVIRSLMRKMGVVVTEEELGQAISSLEVGLERQYLSNVNFVESRPLSHGAGSRQPHSGMPRTSFDDSLLTSGILELDMDSIIYSFINDHQVPVVDNDSGMQTS